MAEAGVEAVLAEVGLTDVADQKVETYSRGMRQRLGIADALLKDPEVLILDEPTTAIDPEGVQEMLALIRRLAAERGATVLLSSHLLHQVQAVCDRVAILVAGRVVALGAPHELAEEGAGPETLELGVLPGSPVTETLEKVSGVHEYRQGRLPNTYAVTVERGGTARLVGELVASGVGIVSLRRTSEDLDHVYRTYFEKEATHG